MKFCDICRFSLWHVQVNKQIIPPNPKLLARWGFSTSPSIPMSPYLNTLNDFTEIDSSF